MNEMIMQENNFSGILVAIVGSTSLMHAINYAISIATKNDAQLLALASEGFSLTDPANCMAWSGVVAT
jgi:hypothetical protein